MNQTIGWSSSPSLTSAALAIPAWPSNMNRQSSADDDRRHRPRQQDGRAHERRGRGRRGSWPARARVRATSSSVTLATAKNSVWPIAAQNRGSPKRLDIVVEPDEGPAEPGHAEIVQVQRLPERPGEGKERDKRDGRRAPASTSHQARRASPALDPVARITAWQRATLSRRVPRDRAAVCISARRRLQRRPPAPPAGSAPGAAAPEESPTARCRPASPAAAPRARRPRAPRRPAPRAPAPSLGSSYSAGRVGNWPTTRARSSICSGRVRYSISGPGRVGMGAVGVDGELGAAERRGGLPSRRAGHRRPPRSGRPRVRLSVVHQGVGVRPVPHERRLAVLESKASLLLVPGEHHRRNDRHAVDLVPHAP